MALDGILQVLDAASGISNSGDLFVCLCSSELAVWELPDTFAPGLPIRRLDVPCESLFSLLELWDDSSDALGVVLLVVRLRHCGRNSASSDNLSLDLVSLNLSNSVRLCHCFLRTALFSFANHSTPLLIPSCIVHRGR